mgnify:CR=1 FL=1
MYQPSLDVYYTIDENIENYKQILNIKNEALNLNELIKTNTRIKELKILEELYFNNFDSFLTTFFDGNDRFTKCSVFHKFNTSKLYKSFLKSDNSLRWEIIRFWNKRYDFDDISNLSEELTFLKTLNAKIIKKIKSLPKSGIENHIYNVFNKILSTAILKLEH